MVQTFFLVSSSRREGQGGALWRGTTDCVYNVSDVNALGLASAFSADNEGMQHCPNRCHSVAHPLRLHCSSPSGQPWGTAPGATGKPASAPLYRPRHPAYLPRIVRALTTVLSATQANTHARFSPLLCPLVSSPHCGGCCNTFLSASAAACHIQRPRLRAPESLALPALRPPGSGTRRASHQHCTLRPASTSRTPSLPPSPAGLRRGADKHALSSTSSHFASTRMTPFSHKLEPAKASL